MLLPCSHVFFVANTQFLLKAARAAGSHHLVWRRRPTISKARFAVTVFHKRLCIIEKYGIVGNLEPKANIYTHTQPVWSSANTIFWILKLRGCASCIDSFNRGKRVMRCCRASLQCNSQWKFAYNAQGNLTLTWTRAWRLPCFLLLNWRQNETNILFLTVTHKDRRGRSLKTQSQQAQAQLGASALWNQKQRLQTGFFQGRSSLLTQSLPSICFFPS